MSALIETTRFHLRPLTVADVTERYLLWLHDAEAERYISSSAATHSLSDLRDYVQARVDRPDVLFLGIFDKKTGAHVGNIKYEPLNSEAGYAVMGILIGDAAYRGRGAAAEVLDASSAWLKRHRGIGEVILTVEARHDRAIRAYTAAGFGVEESPHHPLAHAGLVSMVRRL